MATDTTRNNSVILLNLVACYRNNMKINTQLVCVRSFASFTSFYFFMPLAKLKEVEKFEVQMSLSFLITKFAPFLKWLVLGWKFSLPF